MHYHIRSLLTASVALLLSLPCPAQDSSAHTTIATIAGDHAISFAEIQKYVHDSNYDLILRNDIPRAFRIALEEMVVRELKIIDFFALGLNNDRDLLRYSSRIINEELAIRYYNVRFYGKYVNDSTIHAAYARKGREVFYRRIMLPKPDNASQREVDSLRAAAATIKREADRGVDFNALAKHYSRDADSTSRDGPVHSVNWEESVFDRSSRTIFDLETGSVHIVETKRSVLVVKVDSIEVADQPPFDKERGEIVRVLDRRYADQSLREFDSTKSAFVNEQTLKWNDRGVKLLLQWSMIPGFYGSMYRDTLQRAVSDGRNVIIVRSPDDSLDLRGYRWLLDNILIPGSYRSIDEDQLKQFIVEALRTKTVVAKANELRLDKDIVSPWSTDSRIRSAIARMYDRQTVELQVPEATEQALKSFYNEHRDSLFYQLAKVNVYAITDSNRASISRLRRMLNRDVPFEKLAGRIDVKTFYRDRNGVIKSYLSPEKPFLGKAAFTLKVNQVAGPVEYIDPGHGKQYALIKCIARQEERQLEYRDVEKRIAADYTNYYTEKIRNSTIERLKKKYPVVINREALDMCLASEGITAHEAERTGQK